MMEKKHAEDYNYWKTGRSSPDIWIEKAIKQIQALGGEYLRDGYGRDETQNRSAFMIEFRFGSDHFRIVWPILESRSRDHKSAKIQAATMVYHYIKSVCLYGAIVGPKTAFFSHYLLDDGRSVSLLSDPEILERTPRFLLGTG